MSPDLWQLILVAIAMVAIVIAIRREDEATRLESRLLDILIAVFAAFCLTNFIIDKL